MNYKKIVLLLCSVILLCSCNNPKYKKEIESIKESASSISQSLEDEFKDYVFDAEGAQKLCASGTVIAEDGYYIVTDSILNKYDIRTGIMAPLCSKINCNHNSETCDAYVFSKRIEKCNCLDYKFIYYNSKLYCVEVDENQNYTLYRYNKLFSDKEKVIELASFSKDYTRVEGTETSMVVKGDYLYYVIGIFNPETVLQDDYIAEFKCCRLNMSQENSQPEILYTLEAPADTFQDNLGFSIIYNDDYIVYFHQSTGRFSSKNRDIIFFLGILAYSLKDGKCELVLDFKGDENQAKYLTKYGFLEMNNCYLGDDNNIYFRIYNGGLQEVSLYPKGIGRYDIKDHDVQCVYETSYTEISNFASDGKNLYFFEVNHAFGTLDGKAYFTATDMEGNVICRKELGLDEDYVKEQNQVYERWKENGANMSLYTLCQELPEIHCLDERYVILYGDGVGYANLSTKYLQKHIMGGSDAPCGIGIIKKSDLLSGDELNIKQIYSYE